MDIWVVRGGWKGWFESDSIKYGIAIIGWNMGNLSSIKSRDELTEKVRKQYPNYAEGHLRNSVTSIFSFVNEISTDDIILMPLKRKPFIAIGKVTGTYRYDYNAPEKDSTAPEPTNNRILVNWINLEVPRDEFTDEITWYTRARSTITKIKNEDVNRVLAIIKPYIEN